MPTTSNGINAEPPDLAPKQTLEITLAGNLGANDEHVNAIGCATSC